DRAVRDLDVAAAVAVAEGAEAVEPALDEELLEQRAPEEELDPVAAQARDLAVEVPGDQGCAPAELDEVDERRLAVDHVLEEVRGGAGVDGDGDAGAAGLGLPAGQVEVDVRCDGGAVRPSAGTGNERPSELCHESIRRMGFRRLSESQVRKRRESTRP